MKPPNVVESWIVNPKLSKSDFEGKQPPVDNGHARLDPARYHSEAFMALEWERLWTRVWLIAGVESDIPEPGDYLLYRIRHEEIICVRQPDGSVKAMYNVCPHRGNRVVFGERGSLQRFTCALSFLAVRLGRQPHPHPGSGHLQARGGGPWAAPDPGALRNQGWLGLHQHGH